MRNIIVVAVIAATPAVASAVMQRRGGGLQEEAPIRVCNGSVDVHTLADSKWVAEAGQWSQDRTSPGFASVITEVRYADGGTCTLRGGTVTIKYKRGTATRSLRIHRTGQKLKVTPRADFNPPSPQDPYLLRSTEGEFVTSVTSSAVPNASCDMTGKEELLEVCIATTEIGLANCRSKR
jgi:hypothetical protein